MLASLPADVLWLNVGRKKQIFHFGNYRSPQTFQYARQDIARKIMLVEWKIYYYKFLAPKPVNSALSTDSFIASFWKIIESLFVNANAADTKQLSGAETLLKFRETPGPRLEVIFPSPRQYLKFKMPRRQQRSKRTLSNVFAIIKESLTLSNVREL